MNLIMLLVILEAVQSSYFVAEAFFFLSGAKVFGICLLLVAIFYLLYIQGDRCIKEQKVHLERITSLEDRETELQGQYDSQDLLVRQYNYELNRCKQNLEKLNKVRSKFYDKMLYEKYREYTAVSMMYDYLAGGAAA